MHSAFTLEYKINFTDLEFMEDGFFFGFDRCPGKAIVNRDILFFGI
jgi:hypothetical protein